MNHANLEYMALLHSLSLEDSGPSPRGQGTREIMNYQSVVDMRYPIVSIPERELDYEFMVAEPHWMIQGTAALDHHPAIRRNLQKYSDDGTFMTGAYGPPFITQLRYVTEKFRQDPDTRQAVMTFWRQSPRDSRDIPCTVAMQFMIRKDKFHTNVFMRSSDAWLGWPYDVFSFSMLSAYVLLTLQSRVTKSLEAQGVDLARGVAPLELELGTLTITAGSQHLYGKNYGSALPVIHTRHVGKYKPILTHGLNNPDYLFNALGHALNAYKDNPRAIFDLGETLRSF